MARHAFLSSESTDTSCMLKLSRFPKASSTLLTGNDHDAWGPRRPTLPQGTWGLRCCGSESLCLRAFCHALSCLICQQLTLLSSLLSFRGGRRRVCHNGEKLHSSSAMTSSNSSSAVAVALASSCFAMASHFPEAQWRVGGFGHGFQSRGVFPRSCLFKVALGMPCQS